MQTEQTRKEGVLQGGVYLVLVQRWARLARIRELLPNVELPWFLILVVSGATPLLRLLVTRNADMQLHLFRLGKQCPFIPVQLLRAEKNRGFGEARELYDSAAIHFYEDFLLYLAIELC